MLYEKTDFDLCLRKKWNGLLNARWKTDSNGTGQSFDRVTWTWTKSANGNGSATYPSCVTPKTTQLDEIQFQVHWRWRHLFRQVRGAVPEKKKKTHARLAYPKREIRRGRNENVRKCIKQRKLCCPLHQISNVLFLLECKAMNRKLPYATKSKH